MTRRRVILVGFFALAAIAGTLDLYDVEGKRIGSAREGRDGSVNIYDAESNRAGWGRRNRDGSIELFDAKGNRVGTITRDGRVIQMHGREGR